MTGQNPRTMYSIIRDGAVIAALIGGAVTIGIYWSGVLDERSQLRSDVRHLTDSVAELRKDLDTQRLENKQLNDLFRQSQMDLTTRDIRLAETEKRLANTDKDAISAKTEADRYKALAAPDKRCKQYSDEVRHLESQLNMSELDVYAPTGERRVETLEALKRSRDSRDLCLSSKP